jgi:hypothetical protein
VQVPDSAKGVTNTVRVAVAPTDAAQQRTHMAGLLYR